MFQPSRHTILAGSVAAVLAAGGLGGAAWAAHAPSVAAVEAQTATGANTMAVTSTAAATASTARAGALQAALDQLVAKGTINSSQEQAVETALQQYRPAHRQPLGGDVRQGLRRAEQQAIAKALNLPPKQLHQDRLSGLSIAQIAQQQHVPLQLVSNAVVAAVRGDLDAAVSAGHLSAQQEQRAIAALQKRLPRLLNASAHGKAATSTTSASSTSAASSTAAP